MNIIPLPRIVNKGKAVAGDYLKNDAYRIYTNAKGFLPDYIKEKLGYSVNIESSCLKSRLLYLGIGYKPAAANIAYPEILSDKEEGYFLYAGEKNAFIASHTEKGLFYGIQTLLQIIEEGLENEIEIIDWPHNGIRGFHLELRFGVPLFNRVLEIIDEIALYKFNTLLLEYEDKFPYMFDPGISAKNAFSEAQIKEIISCAKERFIEVIPLQQTLGHLEYVLKKDRYHSMREVRENPVHRELPFSLDQLGFQHFNHLDEICPVNEDAFRLVEALCNDVIQMHPDSRHIHIGCDEAWNLMYCKLCREKYNGGRNRIFIEHVNRIAEKIIDAGKTPVMWDDMLRHFDDHEMRMLNKNIILVCWLYYGYEFKDAENLIGRYKRFSFKVIGASSAKCSAGLAVKYLDLPDFDERMRNISMWSELTKATEILGMVTTIWSNYTGTIAPPHPFFDTAWYPAVFSAERYWNPDADAKAFESRFLENYFGLKAEPGFFGEDFEAAYKRFDDYYGKCTRHKYTARVYKWMNLMALYRRKSLAVGRELYKLFNDSTKYEKDIVLKKYADLALMRQYLKDGISGVLSLSYTREDIEEFLNSRFFNDEKAMEYIKKSFAQKGV